MGRNGGKTEAKVVANQGDWEILLEEQVEVLGFFSQDFHQHSVIEHFSSFKPQGRLTLLEVYTDWAGPCTAMATILAKVKVSKRESNQLKKNLLTTSPTSSSSSSSSPPSSSSKTTPARAADGEAWFKRWLPTPSYPHLCLRLCGHCPGERIY